MKYLAHRGMWNSNEEKNSKEALLLSISSGFGFETDLRDFIGQLVVSHDIADEKSIHLESLKIPNLNQNQLLAWNVKADGLIPLIKSKFDQKVLSYSVFFDMSIPETIVYNKNDLPYLVRLSEYESLNNLYNEAKGVWIDSFHGQWYDSKELDKILSDNKIVVIVSPELHKREHLDLWCFLKESGLHLNDNIYLCTDYPKLAKEFFDSEN
jgi:glycerophosphoryl diester phosphodiesterase